MPQKAFHKTFWGTTKKCENKNWTEFFISVREWDGKGWSYIIDIWWPYFPPTRENFTREIFSWKNLNCLYFRCCYPYGNYLLKVNERNIRTTCEICSRLSHWRRSDVVIAIFNIFDTLLWCFCCKLYTCHCRQGSHVISILS